MHNRVKKMSYYTDCSAKKQDEARLKRKKKEGTIQKLDVKFEKLIPRVVLKHIIGRDWFSDQDK